MARRSHKSRFGPGKDRIKPDNDETGEQRDAQPHDVESDSQAAAGDDGKPARGRKARGKSARNRSGSGEEATSSADDPDHASESSDESTEQDGDAPVDAESEQQRSTHSSQSETDSVSAAQQDERNDGQNENVPADDELATGYITNDSDDSPQTCCPSCRTLFEVSQELLASSDTRVRCGECLFIFDALDNLRDPDAETEALEEVLAESMSEAPVHVTGGLAEQTAGVLPSISRGTAEHRLGAGEANATIVAGSAANQSSLDVTYADFALFSADAGLPEVEYLDETREIQAFDYDDLGETSEFDETIDESLLAADVVEDARSTLVSASVSAGGSRGETPAPLADETVVGNADIDEMIEALQQPELPVDARPVKRDAWRQRAVMALVVVALVAMLFGYRERAALQQHAAVRFVLEPVCSLFGCTLAEKVDLASLHVTRRTVFSHPDLEQTLIINIGFINEADFDQRYPTLDVRLSDINGSLIASRTFEPADYLDNWRRGDVIGAGDSLDLSLNMEDPGTRAMSFEMAFR